MNTSTHRFNLPPKVDSYLATLNRLYERKNEPLLREIVVNGVLSIHEQWHYDNLDGGTYGHAITLKVPEDLYLRIIDYIDRNRETIATDLNKLSNIPNEYIHEVFIEMDLAGTDNWREQTGVYHPRVVAPSTSPDVLHRIWGTEPVRVFLSHKVTVKEETSRLKLSLARCGVAAFVAHEDIEPTEEWHSEIERALFSMDALVALLSPDFHASNWTDQEVGVAIGRGVPLIGIRLGMDPYGLMGKGQGLGGCNWGDPETMAVKIFQLLYKRIPDKSRLFESALAAYTASASFEGSAWKVRHLLSLFEKLTPNQVDRVVAAYRANHQNRFSFTGIDLLQPLLAKWTGKQWTIADNELVLAGPADEIPF